MCLPAAPARVPCISPTNIINGVINAGRRLAARVYILHVGDYCRMVGFRLGFSQQHPHAPARIRATTGHTHDPNTRETHTP